VEQGPYIWLTKSGPCTAPCLESTECLGDSQGSGPIQIISKQLSWFTDPIINTFLACDLTSLSPWPTFIHYSLPAGKKPSSAITTLLLCLFPGRAKVICACIACGSRGDRKYFRIITSRRSRIPCRRQGSWSLSRVSIPYDTYTFYARLEHLESKFSLSWKRHQDHSSMPTCCIHINEMLIKTRNLSHCVPQRLPFLLAVTPTLTDFESNGTLPCRWL
jgi:hypothetical protein